MKGFDDNGLPLAGTECEARFIGADNAEWFMLRVLAVDCGFIFGWAGKNAMHMTASKYEYRAYVEPVDPRREVIAEAISKGRQAFMASCREEIINNAIRKLDNLPPF